MWSHDGQDASTFKFLSWPGSEKLPSAADLLRCTIQNDESVKVFCYWLIKIAGMAPQAAHNSSWHISSINVKAFKSFSQPACFDVSSSGLVGVVGPNGSGKSNLLEAVCFAAGCGTSVLRGCRALRDVASTDAGSQLPSVKLTITRGKCDSHQLETSLTPEGTRLYKVDSRLKTGTQVKDFLRGLGIVVDSTTVIQQTAITRLTDSNNPSTLADLVATASGLNGWNQETAAARQEITRTRRALKDIQANIIKIQTAAAADEQAIQASLTAARLEQELEQLLVQLVSGLHKQQAHLEQQVAYAHQREQDLQTSNTVAAEELQQLVAQKQQLVTQQAQILADLDSCSTSETSSSLVCKIAAAEAMITSLKAEAEAYAAQQLELQACKQQAQQHEAKAQQLRSMLQLKKEAAAQANSSLAAATAAGNADECLQHQALELQKQTAATAAALAQQQITADYKTVQLQQALDRVATAEQRLQAMLQHQQHSTNDALSTSDSDVTAATAAARAAAAVAHQYGQQLSGLQQQLSQICMDLELRESSLTPQSTAGLLSSCCQSRNGSNTNVHASSSSTSSRDSRARLLHQCFTVKGADNPQAISALLVPLAVIAGPSVLQVFVADTMQDANKLLAAAARGGSRGSRGSPSGKLRIWPLDNLKANSFLTVQRAAQQSLGSDRVILPLDLLQFEQIYEAAMIRAFGGYVIAADDATAAELVQRFGLSSVTKQGTVSRTGSMSGGWAGNSASYGQTYWSNKLQYDTLAAQVTSVQDQLAQSVSKQRELDASRSKAEAVLAAVQQQQELQQCKADAAAASDLAQQEQQHLSELQQRHSGLQQSLQQCKAALQTHGGGSRSNSGSSKRAAAVLKQQLQEDAKKAAAEIDAVQQQLQATEDEVEQCSIRQETLQLQISSLPAPQQQQEQLQQQTQLLQQLQQQKAGQQNMASDLSERLQHVHQQQQETEQQLQHKQRQLRTTLQSEQQAATDAAAASERLKRSKQELKQLAREFADHEIVQELVSAGQLQTVEASEEGGLNGPTTKDLQQYSRRATKLQQELSDLEVPELPAAQKELCQSRVAQVLQFKQQAQALEAAATALEQHIATCAEQVYAANDAVFEDIAAGFTELCSSLLPSLELQLERTGQLAHEGLQFRFRRLEDIPTEPDQALAGSDSSKGSTEWHASLGQLSGGQQTLVSLAMLLAVARSGNGSKLFLLDEIDAALDEHNQTRASALLKQLCHAGDGSTCQILCVTHNVAFQQVCDAFVQVVRGPNGSSMPAAAAEGQAEAASRIGSSAAAINSTEGRKSTNKKARTAAAGYATARTAPSNATASGTRNAGSRSNKKVRFARSDV